MDRTPGKHWVHLVLSTYAAWLPGDERGWRSRDHKIHSSGDHRHRPPPGEHAGLHRYAHSISEKPMVIPRDLRPLLGRKLVEHFTKLGHRVRVLSVGGQHVHALIELPIRRADAEHEVGRCKQAAALLVTGQFKPRLWAKDSGLKPIRDDQHFKHTQLYIRGHYDEGAWVWSEQEGEVGTRGR